MHEQHTAAGGHTLYADLRKSGKKKRTVSRETVRRTNTLFCLFFLRSINRSYAVTRLEADIVSGRKDRSSTMLPQAKPVSGSGTQAEQSAPRKSCLLRRACNRTPDSVVGRHLSLCDCRGRSWLAGCYPTSPSRLRCERAGWSRRRTAPTDKPAPHTLLLISRRSRLAADITADAGARLPHPFTPYRAAARRDCSLLPSCVTCDLRHMCPRLRFRGAAFHR